MLLNVSTVGFIVILLALFKVVPGKIRPYVLLVGSVLFVYSEGGAAGLSLFRDDQSDHVLRLLRTCAGR